MRHLHLISTARPTGRRSRPRIQPPPSSRRTHTPRRTSRASALAAMLLIVTGCASEPDDEPTPPDPVASTRPGTPPPSDATPELLQSIEAIAPTQPVELNLDKLPKAPSGFTEAEVEASAERAIDLIRRGVSPDLEGKTPRAAFEYVFANQYSDTTEQAAQASRTATGKYDWEWAWASLFETQPITPARFLALRWQVEVIPSELASGAKADLLQVTLSTAIEHRVPNGTGTGSSVAPIVVQRAVIINSFKPLGGPDWWPAVGMQANPLFGGKCAPVNGSLLTPARRQATLNSDLRRLREYMSEPTRINTRAVSDGGQIGDYVQRYCER